MFVDSVLLQTNGSRRVCRPSLAQVEEGSVVLRIFGLSASMHELVASALLDGDDVFSLVLRESADKLMMSGVASVGIDTRGLVFLGGMPTVPTGSTATVVKSEATVQWLFVPCAAEPRAGTLLAQFLLREVRVIAKTKKFIVWFGNTGMVFDTDLYSDELQSKYTDCLRASPESFQMMAGQFTFSGIVSPSKFAIANAANADSAGGLFVFSDQPQLPQFAVLVAQFAEQRSKWLAKAGREHVLPLRDESHVLLFAKNVAPTTELCAALRVINCARVKFDAKMELLLLDIIGQCHDLVVLSLQGSDCSAATLARLVEIIETRIDAQRLPCFRGIFVGGALSDTALPKRCFPFDDRRQLLLAPGVREEATLLRVFMSVRV